MCDFDVAVADPEVLARGGELEETKGGGCAPLQKIFELKNKNGAFLCTFMYWSVVF